MTAPEQKTERPWSESTEAKMVIEMARQGENQIRIREDIGELKTMMSRALNMQEDLLRHSESIKTLQEGAKRTNEVLERQFEWQKKHEERNEAEFDKVTAKIDEKMNDIWKFARTASERNDGFRNKIMGALTVLSVLWAVAGGGIYWAINTLVEGKGTDRVMNQRIDHIEKQLGIPPRREEK